MSEALRQALKVIDKHSISAIRTNSKDCGDWAEDMAYVGKVAREALAQPPAPTAQPPSVPPTTQALWDACKKAAEAERHACSIAVWMTKMDAQERDADDLGVSGWLEEAERRVKHRTDQAPEAVDSELRGMLIRCAAKAQAALVMGEPSDFNSARPAIAALASFAEGVAYFDAVPIATAQPVQQPGAEPDMRHPKIQALIGSKARCQIELMLVEQLIEDPDCDLTSMDMEYWGPMHDRLKEALTKAAPAQRQPLTAEAVFASKDFMSMNGLYWGLGIETLMQIVRVTERECAAAWGVTLAQKGEKL